MTAIDVQHARTATVELAYQALGDPDHPPVVLIMGLGTQLHYWPDGFCDELLARQLFVVRFDNRDSGLSTHFDDAGAVDLSAPRDDPLPYTMSDLAGDVAALIDALGLGAAHLVGISMGGMMAQQAAIEHPERVRSLVSIASTTGDRQVGQATPEALQAILSPPARPTREAVCENALTVARVIGSPGFAIDEDQIVWRAGVAFDRGYDPAGVSRQTAAIVTAEDRTPRLRELAIPALVVHGAADPLVDVSGGRATAGAIPGCELMVVDGMGHDLPRGVWARVADGVARTVRRAEAG